MACEIGCQFPNKGIFEILEREKKNGKKIYLVSDFYLGKEDMKTFLKVYRYDKIFDDIFVSCDCNSKKASSDLYFKILKNLDVDPNDCIMIGNNAISDVKMANKANIQSLLVKNIINRFAVQIFRRIGYDYSKYAYSIIRNKCYRYGTPYSEYITMLYTFTRRLYEILKENEQHYVTFLAREGLYLKKLFDEYQIFFDERIHSQYLKCSRRAIFTVTNNEFNYDEFDKISVSSWLILRRFSNEEISKIATGFYIEDASVINKDALIRLCNDKKFLTILNDRFRESKEAFAKYAALYQHNNHINLVDIGWIGGMQLGIQNITGYTINGYYLGAHNKFQKDGSINRVGIIFDDHMLSDGVLSKYFHLLHVNLQLYEQLTAASHGSAQRYRIENDNIIIDEEWIEEEKWLYDNCIKDKQEEMFLIFKGLTAWCGNYSFEKCKSRMRILR